LRSLRQFLPPDAVGFLARHLLSHLCSGRVQPEGGLPLEGIG